MAKGFSLPFYHKPNEIALKAAEQVKRLIGQNTRHNFNEQGKMFGVLVVEHKPSELGFLMGYSGKLKNDERPHGFVPPILDVHQKDSFFKQEEKVLDELTKKIENIYALPGFINSKKKYQEALNNHDRFVASSRQKIKANKEKRKQIRASIINEENQMSVDRLSQLSLESKLEQIAYKKEKRRRLASLLVLEDAYLAFEKDIKTLKARRGEKSKKLQEQVFKTAAFLNFKGEKKDLFSLFEGTYEGVPPAGAGECSAPRLLQSCYQQGLSRLLLQSFGGGALPKNSFANTILIMLLAGENVNQF